MPNWDEIQKMMREARTPQEKADAARALAEHTPPEHQGKGLVTLRKGGENVVSLGNLPDAMQSPEVYDRVKKAITKEG